jgi:hypothetical protein
MVFVIFDRRDGALTGVIFVLGFGFFFAPHHGQPGEFDTIFGHVVSFV